MLEEESKAANLLAINVKKNLKKDWFTIYDMVNDARIGHDQAKGTLTHLARYGLVKSVSKDGKYQHKIILNQKERDEMIDQEIESITDEIKNMTLQQDYLKELKKTEITALVKP